MYEPGSLSKNIVGVDKTITTKDGTKLHCIEAGNGLKTVVLVHGFGLTTFEWNIIVPKLVGLGYRIVAFDQRGHGKSSIGREGISSSSMASDILAIFEAYDLQNAVLVGHSMGGFLSIKALITHPELQNRIKGCILMATFAGDVNKNNFQNKLQIPLIKSGILLKLIKVNFIGRAFARSLMGDHFGGEADRAFLEVFTTQNHKALIPILQAFADESYYDELHKIHIPCTIIIGTKDKTTPPFHSEDLVRLIPNSNKVTLEGKGHTLNWEAPDTIVSEIVKISNK